MAAPTVNIADLVAEMPATDKELQARKESETPATPAADPNATSRQRPRTDRWGAASKFTGLDPALANSLFEQALAGGRDSVIELSKLIRDPADAEFKDYKPEYFLHGLAVYVSAPGREARQTQVVQALAAQLTDKTLSSHTRGFIVRELRATGTKAASAAIATLLQDEQFCADAAAALVSLGEVELLRAALDAAKGKCRLTIIQSLGAVQDSGSAEALRAALTDADADVRLAAAWALARSGDAPSIDAMLKLAGVDQSWERIKATQSCLLLAETLVARGQRNEARRIYSHLRATRTQPHEAYIRELADKALIALGIG